MHNAKQCSSMQSIINAAIRYYQLCISVSTCRVHALLSGYTTRWHELLTTAVLIRPIITIRDAITAKVVAQAVVIVAHKFIKTTSCMCVVKEQVGGGQERRKHDQLHVFKANI